MRPTDLVLMRLCIACMPLHLLTKTNLSLEIRFYYSGPHPPPPHTMLGNHLGFYLTQCNIEWVERGLLTLVENGGHIWLNKCIECQQF